MIDSYVYVIVALLPLAAVMLTVQVNPYNALVIRGILGAVAALVYAVLGAADVALTEALVGTMLAITLYAVAVRSSLVMRLGVLTDSLVEAEGQEEQDTGDTQASQRPFAHLLADLRTIASKYHLRLELIPYPDLRSLNQALMEKEVHVTCMQLLHQDNQDLASSEPEPKLYQTVTRVRRLYDILQTELSSPATSLTYVTAPDLGEKH
ncbi:MAG: DUF4040 domain-containing protein [Leptolyngbyaceae bacterium]|nr:DUF4040 domain-containing protein [Leptolyngbyaceae bacterium]